MKRIAKAQIRLSEPHYLWVLTQMLLSPTRYVTARPFRATTVLLLRAAPDLSRSTNVVFVVPGRAFEPGRTTTTTRHHDDRPKSTTSSIIIRNRTTDVY